MQLLDLLTTLNLGQITARNQDVQITARAEELALRRQNNGPDGRVVRHFAGCDDGGIELWRQRPPPLFIAVPDNRAVAIDLVIGI